MPPGRKGAGSGVSHKKREPAEVPPAALAAGADAAGPGRGKRARAEGLPGGILPAALLEPTSTRRSTRGVGADGDVKAEDGGAPPALPGAVGPVGVASAAGQRTVSSAGSAAQQLALRQCERRVQRIEYEQAHLQAGGNLLDVGLEGGLNADGSALAPPLRGAAAASAAAKQARMAALGITAPPASIPMPAARTASGQSGGRRDSRETAGGSPALAPFATPALPPNSGAGASSDAYPGRRFSINVPPAGPTPASAGPTALASPSPTAGPQQATWSIKQWKKQAEPQRNKTHWDYLLEEMEWLSKDFREERQWKVALARKAVKAVSKWHQDRERSERDGDRSTEVHLLPWLWLYLLWLDLASLTRFTSSGRTYYGHTDHGYMAILYLPGAAEAAGRAHQPGDSGAVGAG